MSADVSTRTRARRPPARATAALPASRPELSGAWWAAGVVVILLVAAALRLWALDLRPEHHDEGVNGSFMTRLAREGFYHYDPTNFHGPSLYLLAMPLVRLLGLTCTALRLETALFGIGVIVLVLCLYRRIGRRGALVAAALLAVSPGFVFISRYFIHEMLLLFFTLGVVAAVANSDVLGRTGTLALSCASAALMFATKETANMTLGVLLVADYLAIVLLSRQGLLPEDAPRPGTGGADPDPAADGPAVPAPPPSWRLPALVGGVVFVGVYVAFFSSFGTHWPGVWDSLVALNVWAKTGTKSLDHRAPMIQHLAWMRQIEAPILLLGLLGTGVVLWRRPSRFCVFSAFWGLGMLALYSLIPYKTPWLLLNVALPLAITAGAAVDVVMRRSGASLVPWGVGIVLAFSVPACYSLNFVRYDDNTQPYVYAHTVRDARRLLEDVDRYAATSGSGKDLRVAVVSPEHWPLPWWLRDYPRAIFHGKIVLEGNPHLIIARSDQEAEVEKLAGARYGVQGRYVLRPGLNLTLYSLAPVR